VTSPVIEIEGLSVDFRQDGRRLRVVDDVRLTILPGEALGIVGESGSGKSVTWLAALGLLPTHAAVGGSVRLAGQELIGAPIRLLEAVRGKRIAMIFQDPSSCLNPVRRIGWQLIETLRYHCGVDGRAAQAEALRLLDQVGIADARRRLDDYPHQLSGGLNQRVMIAMALAGRPDVLVADEPTTALDTTIQAQILALLWRLRRESGMALVLISHDLGVVAESVDRVAVMYAGRLVEEGLATDLFSYPRHPYTQGLLAALPDLDVPRGRLAAIPGTVPEPGRLPSGCAFSPRCPLATQRCAHEPPPRRRVGFEHRVLCHANVEAGFSAWTLATAAE
jgi:peptide/nickel transport system ATP-binding protein